MPAATVPAFPLTTNLILRHGAAIHANSTVKTLRADHTTTTATYTDVVHNATRLAAALTVLGIGSDDVVGSMCWNTQEHLEVFFAVPGIGAALHTINIRLSDDQLIYCINHAQDRIILVDPTFVPILDRIRPQLTTVETVYVLNDQPDQPNSYSGLLAASDADGFDWPDVDENSAATILYTTGTTGDPKGVAYSHRGLVVHSFAEVAANTIALCEADSIIPIAPMFHVNGWGLPYSGWLAGSDFVMPGQWLQAGPLCELIAAERPTVAGAVSTIWNDVRKHSTITDVDLSSLRLVLCGGSAVPSDMVDYFHREHGVAVVQGWGMTENGLLALAIPPAGTPDRDAPSFWARTGRVVAGVEARVTDPTGNVLPHNGVNEGEIEVRGPWVTSSYYQADHPDSFHDGWLRTGDIGTIDRSGFVNISDRTKDIIKSGGEWISSVALEGHLMAHPDIVEAAVVGVHDDRWFERPLACIVTNDTPPTAEALGDFLIGRGVPKWWIPERWANIEQVPRTSVGKFDKKALRASYANGAIDLYADSTGTTDRYDDLINERLDPS